MELSTEDRIIHRLVGAQGFISGEEIAHDLRISRTAVWNHVAHLKETGFEIESFPHLGHRLLTLPDKLLPALVSHDLKTRLMGRSIMYFEETTSTSDEADRLARKGERAGSVVIAEKQTSGRGRMGRVWESPVGKGVYLSIILRPALPPARISFITLSSAIAARNAIQQCAGLRAFLKWPNDLLISGKKACGILTEIKTEADRIDYAIVGVGMNVNQTLFQLQGLPEATSLRVETGVAVSRLEIAKAFLEAFDHTYTILMEGGYKEIIDLWLGASETIGRRIIVRSLSGEKSEGVATGLDEDGCLLLRLDTGMTKRITGGDVRIV
ncbi:MAG: biotin--[acetyl-CoA-carboxylase] ligase [Candidatus Aureabacteria bacterium]|nr:biotin--[acetyl-CoA-carboxylase] ligase [Candidatus Auribacterota bacterium]